MFKLDPNPTFAAVVQISVPGGGQLPLRVQFKHKTTTQIKGLLAAGEAAIGSAPRSNAEMIALMVDSVDPQDRGDKTDAQFFEALFEAYPASATDVLRTYMRELTESRVKN